MQEIHPRLHSEVIREGRERERLVDGLQTGRRKHGPTNCAHKFPAGTTDILDWIGITPVLQWQLLAGTLPSEDLFQWISDVKNRSK